LERFVGMEIITGVERRRRWPLRDKLRIVAELEGPGAVFADVARRNEVSRGLLWNWRRQVRLGLLRSERPAVLVPVQITADPMSSGEVSHAPPPPLSSRGSRRSGRMEIDLGSGRCIRVDRDVDADALRRVLEVLAPR
jgi:transposase